MSTIQKAVLDNDVRVLVEPVTHVKSAAIGLWCCTGSAHELAGEEGITHFIEHMLFKGTAKRTAKEIAESIEGRGGILNAFTDKEQTCYYCRVLSDDVENAVDVLTDMLTNSVLDKDELHRERGVVLEEIKRGEDEPSDFVHDLHMQKRWPDHALGKSVIGVKETVGSFEAENLRKYMARRYVGGHVILAGTGFIDPDAFISLAREKLGGLASGDHDAELTRPVGGPSENLVGKSVEQVHFCMGGDSVGMHDPQLHTAVVLDAILGSGMSSRLFQEIREKRGLAYSIGSYNSIYHTGGSFTVYGGTSLDTWPEVREVILEEFSKLKKDGVPDDEMLRTKRSITGNMVLALEGMSTRMIRMTKNELIYGRDVPIEETLAKIDAITNNDIVELARRMLNEEDMTTTAIGPFGEN